MKSIHNITFESIDKNTPEGQLLSTAVCLIAFLQFRDKKPDLVLEVLKDVNLNVFVNEPLEKTMQRIEARFKADNN